MCYSGKERLKCRNLVFPEMIEENPVISTRAFQKRSDKMRYSSITSGRSLDFQLRWRNEPKSDCVGVYDRIAIVKVDEITIILL
jgi:hypothetical protein